MTAGVLVTGGTCDGVLVTGGNCDGGTCDGEGYVENYRGSRRVNTQAR